MKLAILGSGMIVHDFLTITKELPDIELMAIFGREHSLVQMQALAKKYNIQSIYTDYDACLQDKSIDTVYVALPNMLHYDFAKKALDHGKNVICEKPFVLTLAEFKELKQLALDKKLILIEAITNQYLENYQSIKAQMKKLGNLKIIECNYSQYSSRYDAFKNGEILPAFNPKAGGGALMDLNIYNIHFIVGLLGKPKTVQYFANIEKDIDTSGILQLDYGYCKVVCIGSKDSAAPVRSVIQGDKGALVLNGPTNTCPSFEVILNNTEPVAYNETIHPHRMHPEFVEFSRIIKEHDMVKVTEMLEHSEIVMDVVEKALKSADIVLGSLRNS